jgi:Fe2+ transport system protein FeoA
MATDSISQILPIELLRQGERGIVHDLDGNEESVHRLAELGLRQQVELTMIQPGQPCIVRVGDHRLTLRLDPSLQIFVEVSH